ncbi:helix-turn-helix domain-containing protein [Microbacterium sp. RD1]|uniref:helix-turn-helix domain-containing protein n=1 Tax=Microbacterium sp. RD1 TaxID=3457313 RepID=UPI003FA5EFED
MSDDPNHLGAYLRARRGLVTPAQAGVSGGGDRRVPGLRREEVAMLAGISIDYYLRLETGRNRNPSVQVLEAIGRVLQLDDEDLAYVVDLVSEKPRGRRPRPRRETVPRSTRELMQSLPHPAFLEGRYFDILAANAQATALSPRLVPGRNQLRDVFLDPAEKEHLVDWEGTAQCYVSSLRSAVGPETDDPRFVELVGQLSVGSPYFRKLWSRHTVGSQRSAPVAFDHPQLGEIELHRERLQLTGTDGITLVVYHATAGSPAAEKLTLLGATVPASERRALAPVDSDSQP